MIKRQVAILQNRKPFVSYTTMHETDASEALIYEHVMTIWAKRPPDFLCTVRSGVFHLPLCNVLKVLYGFRSVQFAAHLIDLLPWSINQTFVSVLLAVRQ